MGQTSNTFTNKQLQRFGNAQGNSAAAGNAAGQGAGSASSINQATHQANDRNTVANSLSANTASGTLGSTAGGAAQAGGQVQGGKQEQTNFGRQQNFFQGGRRRRQLFDDSDDDDDDNKGLPLSPLSPGFIPLTVPTIGFNNNNGVANEARSHATATNVGGRNRVTLNVSSNQPSAQSSLKAMAAGTASGGQGQPVGGVIQTSSG